MTADTDTIHLRKAYARSVTCGITGPVRFTERLFETTCPRCQHDGDPVPRTRAIKVEAAHAEALDPRMRPSTYGSTAVSYFGSGR